MDLSKNLLWLWVFLFTKSSLDLSLPLAFLPGFYRDVPCPQLFIYPEDVCPVPYVCAWGGRGFSGDLTS